MSIPVLVLGKSGTGKTTSLRNLNPDDCFLLQAIKKPLPFRNNWQFFDPSTKKGSVYVTDNHLSIIKCIQAAHQYNKKIVILDDFQYTMSNEFMRRAMEKGFNKFTEIGKNAWEIVQATINNEHNIRVYILSHTDENDFGENIKMKTIGKMLDDKITMEGMFTIVLRSIFHEGRYFFVTQNNGNDTVKSPMGMFPTYEIDNDLQMIDQTICNYYNI